jgi:hypothetical protein
MRSSNRFINQNGFYFVMTYNKALIEKLEDIIFEKMSKKEIILVADRISDCADFRTDKITLSKLDDKLLFTPNKIKEAVYIIEESMYKGMKKRPKNSIRELIEVDQKPLYDFKIEEQL